MPEVLGISGSPIPHSNTDRAVQAVLEATGLQTEFVKLVELDYEPCRACLGCVETNRCVIPDHGRELARRFAEAPAFVLGAFTPYSSLDARTKAFMERMYCLRHQRGLNRGRIGASVITSAVPPDNPELPPAVATATRQMDAWMMEEGMRHLGVLVVRGNVPCIKCGHGDTCPMSGVQMMHGEDASVASVGVNRFERDPDAQESARHLGERIRAALQPTAPPLSANHTAREHHARE